MDIVDVSSAGTREGTERDEASGCPFTSLAADARKRAEAAANRKNSNQPDKDDAAIWPSVTDTPELNGTGKRSGVSDDSDDDDGASGSTQPQNAAGKRVFSGDFALDEETQTIIHYSSHLGEKLNANSDSTRRRSPAAFPEPTLDAEVVRYLNSPRKSNAGVVRAASENGGQDDTSLRPLVLSGPEPTQTSVSWLFKARILQPSMFVNEVTARNNDVAQSADERSNRDLHEHNEESGTSPQRVIEDMQQRIGFLFDSGILRRETFASDANAQPDSGIAPDDVGGAGEDDGWVSVDEDEDDRGTTIVLSPAVKRDWSVVSRLLERQCCGRVDVTNPDVVSRSMRISLQELVRRLLEAVLTRSSDDRVLSPAEERHLSVVGHLIELQRSDGVDVLNPDAVSRSMGISLQELGQRLLAAVLTRSSNGRWADNEAALADARAEIAKKKAEIAGLNRAIVESAGAISELGTILRELRQNSSTGTPPVGHDESPPSDAVSNVVETRRRIFDAPMECCHRSPDKPWEKPKAFLKHMFKYHTLWDRVRILGRANVEDYLSGVLVGYDNKPLYDGTPRSMPAVVASSSSSGRSDDGDDDPDDDDVADDPSYETEWYTHDVHGECRMYYGCSVAAQKAHLPRHDPAHLPRGHPCADLVHTFSEIIEHAATHVTPTARQPTMFVRNCIRVGNSRPAQWIWIEEWPCECGATLFNKVKYMEHRKEKHS